MSLPPAEFMVTPLSLRTRHLQGKLASKGCFPPPSRGGVHRLCLHFAYTADVAWADDMLFVLKIPLASFGHSCCGLSICSVHTFQKPRQYRPELLTSLANVIHHALGTCASLDKPHNICRAFCNFPLILHTLFSLSSLGVLVRCMSDSRSHARELGIRHFFPQGSVPGEKLGQALVGSWQVSPLPASNGH